MLGYLGVDLAVYVAEIAPLFTDHAGGDLLMVVAKALQLSLFD